MTKLDTTNYAQNHNPASEKKSLNILAVYAFLLTQKRELFNSTMPDCPARRQGRENL